MDHPPEDTHQALELTLRDGLDRLEDFTLMMATLGGGAVFDILSITPPEASQAPTPPERLGKRRPDGETVVPLDSARRKGQHRKTA